MQKQAARAAWLVLGEAVGLFVDLDIHVIEPDLPALDSGEGIADIQFAEADGFHLTASEFHTSLITFEDVVIPESFPVGGDFFRHEAAELEPPVDTD